MLPGHHFPSEGSSLPKCKEDLLYFSDGAASQYKNFKNFSNLLYHEEDFGMCAEWHFFTTSHGKNACDGVGGTVKREAAKASLQAAVTGHILTPQDLYNWAQSHIQNVAFFFVGKEDVAAHTKEQQAWFANVKAVPGTRSHHCFIPTATKKLVLKRVSGDEDSMEVDVLKHPYLQQETESKKDPEHGQEPALTLTDCEVGKFLACVYDGKWWAGLVRDHSEEENDVRVTFMHPHGPAKSFRWPAREDVCWVPLQSILCLLKVPMTSNGRQYHLDSQDKDHLTKLRLK